ncbi:MAG: NADH-quinone oxidoreductase subunit N [Gemmataceae bacterium]
MNTYIETALTGFPAQLLPEIVLGLAACVLFLGATWKVSRHVWGVFALAALAGAAAALLRVHRTVGLIEDERNPELAEALRFAAPVLFSKFAVLFKVIGLATGALLVLLGWDEGGEEHAGEYHGCLLLIAAGVCLTGAANDLITLFLALELISIPTYILLYLPRVTAPSQEAAVKYFLLSVFSSGLLLFGFSYLYGVTGTTNIPGILDALSAGQGGLARSAPPWRGLVLVSLVMVVAGLGFRITAVPFHFYAPDVYQGTTTPSAGLLAFIPKVVGFAALVKLLGFVGDSSGQAMGTQVPVLLWIMAAVTMSLGNILALWQTNVKRLLAYSSIAHAGYMLIGLAVAPRLTGVAADAVSGVEALLFYLVAYGAMTLGAFAVLHVLSLGGKPVEDENDLVGLGKTHPGMALVMALFLFSLIGMPLTAGFVGKFLLFFDAIGVGGSAPEGNPEAARQAAEQARLYGLLALIGAVNAAVGAWYYLRLASAMYLREAIEPLPKVRWTPAVASLAACAVLTVALGVFPSTLLDPIRAAMRPAVEAPKVAQR